MCTTARHLWKRSCAAVKRWLWWGAATQPAKRRFSSRRRAKRVHMLVRSSGLAESMSRYLIRRIEQNPAIVLRTNTEIVALEGSDHLERVSWRDASDRQTSRPTT